MSSAMGFLQSFRLKPGAFPSLFGLLLRTRYARVRVRAGSDIISTVANPSSSDEAVSSAPAASSIRTFANFLESCGPDSTQYVSGLVRITSSGPDVVATPEIELHCEYDSCSGVRRFSCHAEHDLLDSVNLVFLSYTCKNCEQFWKIFALAVQRDGNKKSGTVQKLGEIPPYGPPIPSRVMKLVGEDRELFLKGRRAELHGLGIGAFAYYRRVVEEQKGRIIEEIGKVAVKIRPSKETAELFAKAKAETQFTRAIDMIKAAIPEAVLIDGNNPLTLLHSALSEGLHAQTDEQCLELATSIRIVLTELAENISSALKEEATLKNAVNRLLNRTTG